MLLNLGYGLRCGVRCPKGAISPYLDGILASTVMELDATLPDSYPGTGTTLANVIASPADGAAQTDYDFWLGQGGEEALPAFTGTAGDSGAYFAMDGNSYFVMKNYPPAFMANMHKYPAGSSDWWIAFTFFVPSHADHMLLGMDSYVYPGTGGYDFRLSSDGKISVVFRPDDTTLGYVTLGDIPAATPTLVILSRRASDNTLRYWINGDPMGETSLGSKVYTDEHGNLGTNPTLGAHSNNQKLEKMISGTRLYGCAMGQEFLGNVEAAKIRSHLAARHGRSYG